MLSPPVDAVPEPRTGDVLRILGWTLGGFRYGALHGKLTVHAVRHAGPHRDPDYTSLVFGVGCLVVDLGLVLLNQRATSPTRASRNRLRRAR